MTIFFSVITEGKPCVMTWVVEDMTTGGCVVIVFSVGLFGIATSALLVEAGVRTRGPEGKVETTTSYADSMSATVNA